MLPKLNNVEFNEDKATPFHVVAPFEPMGDGGSAGGYRSIGGRY